MHTYLTKSEDMEYPMRELMAPHDVISRVDLGSFIEAYGGESRQTIFDLISEITDSMKRMSGAIHNSDYQQVANEMRAITESALTIGLLDVVQKLGTVRSVHEGIVCKTIPMAQARPQLEAAYKELKVAFVQTEGYLKEWYRA